MELKHKLKELRVAKGLTQSELGDALGVNPKVISKWENGESLPQSEWLPAIADLYDISLDTLFGRECKKDVDATAVMRAYGFDHADGLADVQKEISYAILGMQERGNRDMGCYSEDVLAEISAELLSAVEANDERPQCYSPDEQDFVCHYVRDGFGITTLTHCAKSQFDSIMEDGYPPMRALFRVLAAEGAERLLKFFLSVKDKRCFRFTLDYATEQTGTDKATAKAFLAFLTSLNRTSSELILDKRTALIEGVETDVYDYYPGYVTRMLKTVLLAAHLLLEEKGGFR